MSLSSREYRGTELVEFCVVGVPSGMDSFADELVARFHQVRQFKETICGNSSAGNMYFGQLNYHNHGVKLDPDCTWENATRRDRDFIISGLMRHAQAVILQKRRAVQLLQYIECTAEQERVLRDCDVQLAFVWQNLDPFSGYDDNLKVMQECLNRAYEDDPNLNEQAKAFDVNELRNSSDDEVSAKAEPIECIWFRHILSAIEQARKFCKELVKSYGVHIFDPLRSGNTGAKVNPREIGTKSEKIGISQWVWAYQAGDVWAKALHDIFLRAMVQAAFASSGGLSEKMRSVIKSNYEFIYRVLLDEAVLCSVIRSVEADPADMTELEKLKADRPIPDGFRPVILTSVVSVVIADGQITAKEREIALDIISLIGMDRCVASMEWDRFAKAEGHEFKQVEPCKVDTETLVDVLNDNLDVVEDVEDFETSQAQNATDEVIRLRKEVYRLRRKVVNLTHMLHESRNDRRVSIADDSMGSHTSTFSMADDSIKKNIARMSMKLKEVELEDLEEE